MKPTKRTNGTKIPVEILNIRPIVGSPRELSTEIVRLFALYAHDEGMLQALGINKEDRVANLCSRLPELGGALIIADDGRRLKGLAYLEPQLESSAMLNTHVWKMNHLVLASDADESVVDGFVEYSLKFLKTPVDFLQTTIPASDGVAINSLRKAGFKIASGEIIAVATGLTEHPLTTHGIRIGNLSRAHLDEAADLVGGCHFSSPYAQDSAFDPQGLRNLARYQLLDSLHDQNSNTIVAMDETGRLSGLASYRLENSEQLPDLQPMAQLDRICIAERFIKDKAYNLLGRKVLNLIASAGVGGVMTRLLMNGNGSCARMASLKKMGFEVIQSNLLMHRWVTYPKREAHLARLESKLSWDSWRLEEAQMKL